ncbi:MAG: TolC family protein [Nitrospirae bacterium]|nr:TolC family protein [Nitrospirota bacterium]
MKRDFKSEMLVFTIITFLIFISRESQSLTLNEAISLAKETLPSYKASLIRTKSTEALYNASLSPYLPSLDATSSQNRIYTNQQEFSTRRYDITLSYILFDGGNRRASRNIAGLNFNISKEELRKSLLDLEFNVKTAFYTAIARKETLKQRKIQLQDAQKDYEVAEGRYKFGVAKLLDVLQASVRLEQAKFNVVQAEGEFKKSLSELSSLIGKPLNSQYEIEGSIDMEITPPDMEKLSEAALQRPEIKQSEDAVKIAENNRSIILSTFLPTFSLNASYLKTEGGVFRTAFPEEKVADITATWNIFELGKFFRLKSSGFEKDASYEQLNELKRQILLDVHKTYEDFITASNNLKVAQQQLRQAEHNYSQAFGEYKVGKADILSLVQAEGLLANAREQFINSKLNLILSKALLERIAGIERLENI